MGAGGTLIERDPAMNAAPGRHAACGYVIHAYTPLSALPRCDESEGPLGRIILRTGEVPEHLDGSALARPGLEVSPEAVLIKPREGGRDLGRILVRDGREIIVAAAPGCERAIEAYVLGSGLGAICFQNGLLPLHASAVAIGGEAIAFAGPSGAGKSTTAAAIAARGHRHLTDDIAVLQMRADAPPALYPGTRTMKLSAQSAGTLGLDPAHAEEVAPGHHKRRFGSISPIQADAPAGLAALYFLQPGDVDGITIAPLIGVRAVAAIGGEIYRRAWLQPMGLLEVRLRDIAEVARRTPCFTLTRPNRFEMLPELVDAVLAHHAALRRGRP